MGVGAVLKGVPLTATHHSVADQRPRAVSVVATRCPDLNCVCDWPRPLTWGRAAIATVCRDSSRAYGGWGAARVDVRRLVR